MMYGAVAYSPWGYNLTRVRFICALSFLYVVIYTTYMLYVVKGHHILPDIKG